MRRAILVALGLAAACRLDSEDSGTAYRCDGECPAGQECRDGTCVAIGTPDAAVGGVDAAGRTYRDEVLADRPILYLRLGEAEGAVAADSSGHGRDGTYEGGVARLSVGAVPGDGAAAFDGIDDRVVVPDDDALRLNGDFTVEFWLRVDGIRDNYPGVLSKGNYGETGTGWMFYYRDAVDSALYLKRANMDQLHSQVPLERTGFHHVAVTYAAADQTLRWYVDEEPTAVYPAVSFPENLEDVPLSVGMSDDFGQEAIDEVAIYATALSAERLAAHVEAAAALR